MAASRQAEPAKEACQVESVPTGESSVYNISEMAGGALAGATTFNGLSQGLWVGVGAGAIIFGLRSLKSGPSLELLIMTLASSLCLALVGSWFGSHLLPPAYSVVRRKPLLARA